MGDTCQTEVTPLSNGRFLHYCPICKVPPKDYPSAKITRACGEAAIQAIRERALLVPPPKRGPCVHRGEKIRDQECATCGGNVRIFVFACPIKTACSVEKPLPGVACCAICPSYEPISSAE